LRAEIYLERMIEKLPMMQALDVDAALFVTPTGSAQSDVHASAATREQEILLRACRLASSGA